MSSVRLSSRELLAIAALVLVGLALRWAAWRATWPAPLFNDELFYYFASLNWVNGTEPFSMTRPPGMTLLNAAVMEAGFGVAPGVVRGSGVFLGSILVLLVYLIARRLGSRRAALAAAAITALYPNLVGFSHYIYSETLFLVFALLALWLTIGQQRRLSLGQVACAGVLCGMAALTREVGVALTAGLAVSIVWLGAGDLRRRVVAACLLVALASAVVAPWAVHVYRATGEIHLVGRTTWLNLYLGNPAPGTRSSMRKYEAFGESRSEREAEARRRTISAIRERMPWWPVEKLRVLLPLFQPTSFPVKRLISEPGQSTVGVWRYKFSWPALDSAKARKSLAAVVAGSYVGVAILGLAGLVLCRRRDGAKTLWIFALSIVVPTLMIFPNTRFRLPVEPILILGTALVVSDGKELWRLASAGRRMAAAVALVAMAGLIFWEANAFLSPNRF